MDVQNISNHESPLYNTLVTRSQRDPWTYSLLSNIGSFSKSRVEVPPQTDPSKFLEQDQEVHWKIPRYGLLAKVCILNRIEYTDADADTVIPDFQDAMGFYLWKEIKLETHNKRIQALYPEYQQMRMKSLPTERRESMEGAVVADGSALANTETTSQTRQFYTPTFFSFSERTNNFIDTRFVENLEVVGVARKGSEISTLSGANTMQFASGYPKLVCYFYNPTEEIYRAYQHRNFTLERPLTMLQYDVFRETPEQKKQGDTEELTVNGKTLAQCLTFTKKLDCNNLVYATHLMVREKRTSIQGAQSAGALTRTAKFTPATSRITFIGGNPFNNDDFVKITGGTVDKNPMKGRKVGGDDLQTYGFDLGVLGTNATEGSFHETNDNSTDGRFFKVANADSASCHLIHYVNAFKADQGGNSHAISRGTGSDDDGTIIYTVESHNGLTFNPGYNFRPAAVGSVGHRDHASFLQIENVKVSGTSRELVNQPGYELLHLDNASYNRASASPGGLGKGLTEAAGEAIYSLYWGLDNSRVACSGALSLKNLAAPEIEVKVDISEGYVSSDVRNYELLIFHEFWQLVSLQGSDGRVSVGISV